MRYEIDGEYTVGFDDNDNERERFITPSNVPLSEPVKQWSRGGFISLFSATEWDNATKRAEADVIAKQFMAVLYNSDFILADDERLLRGLDYFRYLGDIVRSNAEILA